MNDLLHWVVVLNWAAVFATLSATIRQAIPITLGSMSGISSERSGIVNIGIEGMMLMSAFSGYMMNVYLSSLDIGMADTTRLLLSVAVGILTGGLLGLLHAVLCIQYKVDHIISGTVINLLAVGITGYFYDATAETKGKIPNLIKNPWKGDHYLKDVGVVLFDKDIITYLTFIIVAVMTFWLFNTTWGLRTRSIGENPRAADTLGINVYRLQYTNLFLSGALAGLAGVYLTLADVGVFERGMTAGKGFIALAVMIFGKWHPMGALGGALLFGFLTALQNQLQFFGVNMPHQLVSLLPYVVTVVVLAGFVGQARPPAHVGQAYETEGH
ncbi:MAG: ABC transporter permease [Anaerolineales bacterium]|nr:ABC transporter permease [Anaerolineales bacterium]